MKSVHTLLICAVIFFVGFSCSKATNNDAALAGSQKWEYYLTHRCNESALNKLGTEGWELITLFQGSSHCGVFKRPLK